MTGEELTEGGTVEKPKLLDYFASCAESADLSGLGGVEVAWYFRAVLPDLRSRYGFRYPWPGQWAEAPGPIEAHEGACPVAPGDGLCVAKDFVGASSGGIRLGTLLLVGVAAADVLGGDDHKLRVRRMYVADLLDVATVLGSANLRYANLRYANLRSADLGSANLGSADLGYADLGYADLGYADLGSADLGSANLRYANLRSADLGSANLRSATYNQLTMWPTGFDPQAAGAVLV